MFRVCAPLVMLTALACGGARAPAPLSEDALGDAELPVDSAYATWVKDQNTRSRAFLASDAALLAAIKARNGELAPGNAATRTHLYDLELTVSKGSLVLVGTNGAADRTVVDVATLEPGSAVTEFRVSPDQTKLAYAVARNGTDWMTWKVIDLATSRELAGPFVIKSSGLDEMNWATDSSGLFYENWLTASDDESGKRQPQIRFHALGTDRSADVVVFEDDESPKTIKYNAQAIDEKTAVVYRSLGSDVPIALYLAKKVNGVWRRLQIVKPGAATGRFVGKTKDKVFVRTTAVGNRYGIVAYDVATLQPKTIVAERAGYVLSAAQQIGNRLVLQYLDADLKSSMVVTDLDGVQKAELLPSAFGMPDHGTFSTLTGTGASKKGFFTYQSVTAPPETFVLDVTTDTFTKLSGRAVAWAGSKVKTELRRYTSTDGTSIPIWVYTRTDLATPPPFAYLFIYGNIGIPNLPQFNRKLQLMLDLGGAVAIAAIRGGGEYGFDWQAPGLYDKWVSFEDMATASRFLKREYPSIGDNVVLSGRSYGGMMTMGAYVHYPNDYKVFTPVVGMSSVPDALRNERGWVYFDDLGFRRNREGFIAHDQRHFEALLRWSPLENVGKVTTAKPLMAFAAQYDARVSSQQTGRFVQALHQKHSPATAPIYFLEHENVGHNGRAEAVDETAFVAKTLGLSTLNPIK